MPTRGELPQILVEAGLTLLKEEGSEGLTLRRIAARAGVSHAAPAHHFGGLSGLRNAIAVRGFQTLSQELTDAIPANPDPFQRLLKVSLAYIRFARRQTALFRLMFEQLPTMDGELRKTARTGYAVFQECCTPLLGNRGAAPMETAVWALTHGFATLNMDRPFPSDSPVKVSSYEDALRLLIG